MTARTPATIRTVSLLLVGSLLAIACGEDPSQPPGAASSVTISAGNAQAGAAGEILPAPLAAKVTDAAGQGIADVPVTFVAVAGGGEVVPSSSRTNGAGIATVSWRVGTVAGQQQRALVQLIDTLTGSLIDTAQAYASVVAAAPAAVRAAGGDGQVGAPGQQLLQPLRALVHDAYRNPTSAITVTWTVVSGSGSLSAETSTTDSLGLAMTSLTLGQDAGEVRVQASVGNLTPASYTARTRPGMASRLTSLPGSGFGIARTPGDHLVVSLIHQGLVQRVPIESPANAHTTTVGGTPVVVAVDAAGEFAYVANMNGTLSVVDINADTKVADVSIPGVAHSLALSPRGDRLYVTNTDHAIYTLDLASRAIIHTTSVSEGPWGFAFRTSQTDSLFYVSSRNGAAVSEIDMRTGNVLRTIGVGGRPHGLAISPGGDVLYVADDTEGKVKFVDVSSATVTSELALTGAFGAAITPDGSTLFVTTNDGFIALINTATRTIETLYETFGQPREILVLPSGDTALAANMGGWIDVVHR